MVFGVILAGGIGSRMGNAEKPKQYIKIGDKPIIIHTIEKFYVHDAFEKLIVLCPKQWVEHTRNLVRASIWGILTGSLYWKAERHATKRS